MDLSIFTASQQEDAMRTVMDRLGAITVETHGSEAVKAKVDTVGMDAALLMAVYEDNLIPDPDGSDARSMCEGILIGIAFTLELLED